MKKLALFLLLTPPLIITYTAKAQFELSAQIRPRTEFRQGFKKPTLDGNDPAIFTEQRTRLIGAFKHEKFRTKFSIQDVRIWGEVGQINKTDNLLSVHEAYGDYLFSANSYLRIGRQELVYDDARILGNLDWAAQARSHDAVKFVLIDTTSKLEFHLAATWNQDGTPQEPGKLQSANSGGGGNSFQNGTAITNFQLGNPKSTQFAWFKKSYSGGYTSILALNDVYQDTDSTTWVRPLFGFNTSYKIGKIKLDGTFYYQFGSQGKDTNKVDYSGLMGGLDITYVSSGKVTPTIGFNYLSGDDKTTTDKVEGFNPLYGTHHKFYGLMDYYYVGNGHNGGGNEFSGGIIDIYAKALIKTGGKAKFLAHFHTFMSPTNINYIDGSGNPQTTTELGYEIDLVYVQPLTKGVVLKAGYSQYIAVDGTYYAKGQVPDDGTGFNSWAWVMIDFTPVLFQSN